MSGKTREYPNSLNKAFAVKMVHYVNKVYYVLTKYVKNSWNRKILTVYPNALLVSDI